MDLTIEGKAYVNGEFQTCCIGIKNGKISAVKKILKGDKHLDFGNRLILPAGIDIHVHFRDPGFTYKEDISTGTLAAAFGGLSCTFDMPNTQPTTTNKQSILDKIQSFTKKSYIDFGVYAGITNNNIKNIEEIAKYCNGFKIYLGETTNSLTLNTENLKVIFNKIETTNKPVLLHAEDNQCLIKYKTLAKNLVDYYRSRPTICEETAIRNILRFSIGIASKIHICHLSSCEGLELLRNRPKYISCGVTPHHLLFSIEDSLEPQSYYKVNPPIRTHFDREALFDGIKNGVIDVLESDHAPHTFEEKEKIFFEAPSGLPGVETMFPIFLYKAKRDKISIKRLLSAICEKPAELFNIPKGKIYPGRDADLIVIDLKDEERIKLDNLHYKCKWTPYEKERAIFPQYVFVRGEKLIEDKEIQVNQGFGRFVGE
jgi:dihydroorotase